MVGGVVVVVHDIKEQDGHTMQSIENILGTRIRPATNGHPLA
jgi:hypothetical protein